MNTTITADDLEIDVSEMGVADAAIANGVIAQQQERIAELEAQLAAERVSKQHESERAQELMQEVNKWKRECLETSRLDAGLQAELGKQLLEMKKERDAAQKKLEFLVNAVFCEKHVGEANQMAQDKCPLCERDAAMADARALAKLVNFHTKYEVSVKEWALIQKYLAEETK